MKPDAPLGDDANPCRPRHYKPSLTPPGPADAPHLKSLELSQARLRKAGMLFLLAFAVISLRLVQVTLLKAPDAQVGRLVEPALVRPVEYGRADIVDRNGVVIATTLETPSLFANPRLVANKHAVAQQLAVLLPDANAAEIETKLDTDSSFVWLYRHLTPSQEYAIAQLGITGLDFEHEERRTYPAGALAAHVVGYTDLDDRGQSGIEEAFQSTLSSSKQPLQLSIDLRLQAILKEEMQKAIDEFNGIGAGGLVMDVRSGEVLGLVSLPDFDPNLTHQMADAAPVTREQAAKDAAAKIRDGNDPHFNRVTLGTYEMGSVFKIFNTALGLDDGKVTLNSMFDTTPIHYGRFIIHDFETLPGPASVTEIFMVSSNIGSARMVLESGPEAQKEFLGKLGLLRPAAIEMPEVGFPEVPKVWRDINAMTIAYGHGLGVTQIQTAIAAAAIVNGGVLHPATLIKHDDDYVPAGIRVISENTSSELRKLMRLVVTNGTGKNADVPGYLVGGKTGTPEKVVSGGYAKKAVMSSFLGVFPMNDPQYLVYITIDEPHGNKKSYGFDTGGWVAAPAVKQVIARMAPLFGLRPIEETPEIHRAVTIDLPGSGKKLASN